MTTGTIQFVIITGLSGAGKTEAIRSFEDLGYFCVDNLPPALIPKFAELCAQSDGHVDRIALVSDIRGGRFFDNLSEALEKLEKTGFTYSILFLEASDAVLVRRYKEARRHHPLTPQGTITEGITAERQRLQDLRGKADHIIDTSQLSPRQLRQEIASIYGGDSFAGKMTVTVVSFGYKHGVPLDADLVFDVRFLPNPHYVESLAPFTGHDEAVAEYVFKWPIATRFMEKLYDFIDFLLPQYTREGKAQLIIGIGCTGGRHRSVAIANRLAEFIKAQGYRVAVEHRHCSLPASTTR